MVPREHGEIQFSAIVDVAYGSIHNHARHTPYLRADREIPAPGRGVQACVLLHHDDVAGRGCLDRGRAEMASIRASFRAIQLDGENPSGDSSLRGQTANPSDRAHQSQFVQCVRDGAGVQTAQPRYEVVHLIFLASSGRIAVPDVPPPRSAEFPQTLRSALPRTMYRWRKFVLRKPP